MNRVNEICELQRKYNFRHVETKANPTDLLSRGVSLQELVKRTLWFRGPEWLTNETQWPNGRNKSHLSKEVSVTQADVESVSSET